MPSGNDPEAPAWPAAAYSARAAAAMAPRASSLCHSIRRFNWGEGKPTSEEAVTAEEIRFAKKQQWYVATACITLMAAVFTLAEKIHTNQCEKVIATLVLAAIAFFGIINLLALKKHIADTRLQDDSDRERRGAWIPWSLAGGSAARQWPRKTVGLTDLDRANRQGVACAQREWVRFISRTGRQPT